MAAVRSQSCRWALALLQAALCGPLRDRAPAAAQVPAPRAPPTQESRQSRGGRAAHAAAAALHLAVAVALQRRQGSHRPRWQLALPQLRWPQASPTLARAGPQTAQTGLRLLAPAAQQPRRQGRRVQVWVLAQPRGLDERPGPQQAVLVVVVVLLLLLALVWPLKLLKRPAWMCPRAGCFPCLQAGHQMQQRHRWLQTFRSAIHTEAHDGEVART